MTTLEATKLTTRSIEICSDFKIDFSKKELTNKVLALSKAHQALSFWLRHPMLKKPLDAIWQTRAAAAINVLCNHQLNERVLLETLQNTQVLAEKLQQEEGGSSVKPLISTSWLLNLHQGALKSSGVGETPRQTREQGESLSYLNRLSGVDAKGDGADLQFIVKQWRNWANSNAVMQCAAEYRALLLFYYLQTMHPFAKAQTAVSFSMFYGLLKSAGFSQIADAILVYYAENIERFATVFAATVNSAHLNKHQQVWFEFFIDAWQWAIGAVKTSVDELLLQSHYYASLQKHLENKQLNERQYATVMQLLADKQVRDKKQLSNAAWYRGLYKKLTVRTQERDFRSLCELGFIVMLDKSEFELTIG